MIPSGPGALSWADSSIASSTSLVVIVGMVMGTGNLAPSISLRSISGGEGKNIFLKSSAFSLRLFAYC